MIFYICLHISNIHDIHDEAPLRDDIPATLSGVLFMSLQKNIVRISHSSYSTVFLFLGKKRLKSIALSLDKEICFLF